MAKRIDQLHRDRTSHALRAQPLLAANPGEAKIKAKISGKSVAVQPLPVQIELCVVAFEPLVHSERALVTLTRLLQSMQALL